MPTATREHPLPLPPGWQRTTSRDGTDVAWRLDGPRRLIRNGVVAPSEVAVVLCNGVTCDETYFRHVWAPLAEHSPVIRWHYRGHALSAPPADPDGVTVDAVVEDLSAVVDAAGVQRAVLVGHSYGAKIAVEGHRQLPGRVVGLATVAGWPGRALPTIAGRNLATVVFEGMRLAWRPAPVLSAWRAALRSPLAFPVARLMGFVGPKTPRVDMDDWFGKLAERDMDLMFRMMRAMQAHTSVAHLPDVDVPAVVMMGGRDIYTPPRLGHYMVDLMPNARLVVVPGTTHVLPVEEPGEVVREVRRVLRQAGGTAPPTP